jgi:hypothetical protein
VQALESLHGNELGRLRQTPPVRHESVVQTLLSLQSSGPPGWHDPLAHASLVVQASPSSQGLLLLAFTHPEPGLHESVVQVFESLHPTAGPLHVPAPSHVSGEVQAFSSSHGVSSATSS